MAGATRHSKSKNEINARALPAGACKPLRLVPAVFLGSMPLLLLLRMPQLHAEAELGPMLGRSKACCERVEFPGWDHHQSSQPMRSCELVDELILLRDRLLRRAWAAIGSGSSVHARASSRLQACCACWVACLC